MIVFETIADLELAVGRHLGYSDWVTVTQDQVDAFADVTLDHQWIHVDRERAAEGMFGGTIAHGFLTLSLLPHLLGQVYTVRGPQMVVNYGVDRVRFPSPVPTGARLRAGAEIVAVRPTSNGHLVTTQTTLERASTDRPAAVVDLLTLVVG